MSTTINAANLPNVGLPDKLLSLDAQGTLGNSTLQQLANAIIPIIFSTQSTAKDLNQITDAGLYYIDSNTQNSPVQGGMLVCMKRSSGPVQLVISTESGILYTRFHHPSEANWRIWKQV